MILSYGSNTVPRNDRSRGRRIDRGYSCQWLWL